MNNKPMDIHKRIYNFVKNVVEFSKLLPKTLQNVIFIKQLISAASSMGANDAEADGADSRKDFMAKYKIVRKETKETKYWLKLIGDTNLEFKDKALVLYKEGDEILRIVSTIIRNTKLK